MFLNTTVLPSRTWGEGLLKIIYISPLSVKYLNVGRSFFYKYLEIKHKKPIFPATVHLKKKKLIFPGR